MLGGFWISRASSPSSRLGSRVYGLKVGGFLRTIVET